MLDVPGGASVPAHGSGDVCCGFSYNTEVRQPDPSLPRNLVFNSFTFNFSGGQGIYDAFHGMTDKKLDKFAAVKEQKLVRRIWEVYKKNRPPFPAVAATEQLTSRPHIAAAADADILRAWRAECPELQNKWVKDAAVATWGGISLGEVGGETEGRVVGIEILGADKLTSLPAELGQCAALHTLNLHGAGR